MTIRSATAFIGLGAAVTLALAACVPPPAAPARCAPGLGTPMQEYALFFGRSVGGRGDVSDQEWLDFIEDTVTPALPDGFTAFDARGAWRSPRSGRTIHEATKVIVVALPDGPDGLAAVNRARAAYQARFNQQLVGMTIQPTCATF
jgi:hypothetical protein